MLLATPYIPSNIAHGIDNYSARTILQFPENFKNLKDLNDVFQFEKFIQSLN